MCQKVNGGTFISTTTTRNKQIHSVKIIRRIKAQLFSNIFDFFSKFVQSAPSRLNEKRKKKKKEKRKIKEKKKKKK